jgi:hypothetical protein
MRTWTLSIALALVALGARPVLAQQPRPERPYRGLFGGGVGNTEQLLTVTGSTGVGYDDNILIGGNSDTGTTDTRKGRRGAFGSGSAGLAYTISRSRVSFAGTVNSSATYYPALQDAAIVSRSGGVGATVQISKGTRLTANQTLSYQPLYALGLFPGLSDQPLGQPLLTDESQGARLENHLTTQSDVVLNQTLSRRVGLSLRYNDYRSQSAAGDRDLARRTESAGLGVGLAKGLGLHLGYGRSTGDYGGEPGLPGAYSQNIDAGLDFNRALSLSRRVTLTFGTGSTALKYQDHTQYYLTGNARLNREIGRTWNASLAYNRNANVIDTFRKPVISDSVTIGIGGLISRKMQFQSSIGAALGTVGFSAAANGFSTYFGNAGLSIALTRLLAVGCDYSYYRYVFDGGVDLPLGLSPRMDRQSVRAHLNVWVPLVQRTRRSNAAR